MSSLSAKHILQQRGLNPYQQSLVERTRVFETYAKEGEQVVCPEGHVICTVAKNIPKGGRVTNEEYLGDWQQPAPKVGDLPEQHACAQCGGAWFAGNGTATVLRFKEGWRWM
jgi:hypothetical protein